MKKNIMILAAGALLLMGGCSKSEIDGGSINSTNEISFTASSNKQTKAAALTNDNAISYDFGVFAYYTEDDKWADYTPTEIPNFMNNEQVSHSGVAWTYDPVKYWPNTSGEMISFFAYMPYNETNVVASMVSGVPAITFTQTMIATDDPKTDGISEMIDLVVAKKLDQTKTTAAVTMPFEHVLTRLNFAAKVDHNLVEDDNKSYNTKVFVKGLRILGTEKNTDVQTATDEVAANGDSKFYATASYTMSDVDGVNGEWNYDEATKQATALEATKTLARTTPNFGYGSYAELSVGLLQTGASTSLLTSGEYLFLIPPSENGVEAATDVVIQVDYDIVTSDDKLTDNQSVTSSTATLSMPNGTLCEGVAYNVVMTIGLTEVTLSAEPTDWTEQEEDVDAIPTEVAAYSADGIEDAIENAFTAGVDELKVTYAGGDEDMKITIPAATDNADMTLTLDLSNQTGYVTITTDASYTGALYINAPNATVTINGGTYTGLTSETDVNTLIIAAGTTVNGLTIKAGNVTVYGTLTGNVTATDATTITFMLGSTNGITNEDSDITINDVPTEDGVYYSLDNGAWTKWETTDLSALTANTYNEIAVMSTSDSNTLIYNQLTAIAGYGFKSVDLSEAVYYKDTSNSQFKGNAIIEYVAFPKNLTSLNANCMQNCVNLKSVSIPSGVTSVEASAFNGCSSLKSVELPKLTTSIGDSAFEGCTNLESINLENITTYTKGAFWGCTNLTIPVVLNAGVTDIPSSLFYKSGITSITIPEGVTTIGASAFGYCDNLTINVVIPESVTTLNTAFRYSPIKSLEIKESKNTVTISASAFNSTNVSSFNFPANITTLPATMFSSTKFETLTIPNHIDITSCGTGVFTACNAKSITIEEGSLELNFPTQFFNNNQVLETISFPSNTKSLGEKVLYSGYLVNSITCKATTPPTTNLNTFGEYRTDKLDYTYTGRDVEGDKTLYVPANCKTEYESETLADDGTENYWKTILIDKCGFEVVELNSDGSIPN